MVASNLAGLYIRSGVTCDARYVGRKHLEEPSLLDNELSICEYEVNTEIFVQQGL